MPIARFQLPDGKIARFEVPDGTTPEQAHEMMAAHFSAPQSAPKQESRSSWLGTINHDAANAIVGGVTGAAKLVSAVPDWIATKAGIDNSYLGAQHQAALNQNQLGRDIGADPESIAYKGGEIASQVAGTAGIGGILAKAPMLAQAAPKLAAAIESGGFSLGKNAIPAATVVGKITDAATRVAGGAITGAASGGVINPAETLASTAIGAALPGGGALLGAGRRAVSPIFTPSDSAIRNLELAAGGREKLAFALRNAEHANQSMPLGQSVTMGQGSRNEGIAALERAAKGNNAAAFQDIYSSQRGAMAEALDSMAGTDALRNKIVANRKAMTEPLYAENAQMMHQGEDISAIMDAAPKSMVKEATDNARMRGDANIVADETGNSYSGGLVDALRKRLSSAKDMAFRASDTDSATAYAAMLDKVRGFQEANSPAAAEANRLFRELSPDVNRIDVARALRDKLVTPLRQATGQDLKLTGAQFARAKSDAAELVRKETGQNQTIEQLFADTPKDLKRIQDVEKLIGYQSYLDQAGTGANSTTNQLQQYTNLAKSLGGMLGGMADKTGKVINHFSGTEDALNRLLQNPKLVAEALRKADSRGMVANPTNKYIRAGITGQSSK
jgi:hypothetical protein